MNSAIFGIPSGGIFGRAPKGVANWVVNWDVRGCDLPTTKQTPLSVIGVIFLLFLGCESIRQKCLDSSPCEHFVALVGAWMHPMRAFMHARIHTCIHVSIHARIHASGHPCLHRYIHVWMPGCTDACIHARIHACVHACIHACIHAFRHPCIHTSMHP